VVSDRLCTGSVKVAVVQLNDELFAEEVVRVTNVLVGKVENVDVTVTKTVYVGQSSARGDPI
jgi:hypothetical protein